MAFDATAGGDPRGPLCKACKRPIRAGEPRQHINFDAHDAQEMSGPYHAACARPFASIAHAMAMMKRLSGGL